MCQLYLHLQVGPSAGEGRPLAPNGFTAAIATGLSVRLWKTTQRNGPSDAAAALLWDQTRVDVLSVSGK
jgi:hypothetical protein